MRDETHIASKTLGRYTSTEMYTWGDIKKEIAAKGLTLEDADILICGLEEGYEYNNSSNETDYAPDKYVISIVRYRDETDEELAKREKSWNTAKEWRRKLKYQEYLELKKEFEGEGTTAGDQG